MDLLAQVYHGEQLREIRLVRLIRFQPFIENGMVGDVKSGVGGLHWFKGLNQVFRNGANGKPGAVEYYSNFAAAFCAVLVEKISGMKFQQFTQTYIFDKLEMTRTSWGSYEANAVTAWPYWYSKSQFKTGGPYCFVDFADGQLMTTASDLAKFDIAIMNFGALPSGIFSNTTPRIYSEATGKLALSCADYSFPKAKCSFGLGWALSDVGDFTDPQDNRYLPANAGYCAKVPNFKNSCLQSTIS